MNVACSMRSAWEVIQTLAQRANLQAKRQLQIQVGRRVTFQGPPPRQEEAKEGVEQIDTSSRPQETNNRLSFAPPSRFADMPPKPKRKLPLYIPRIMADLIWATTKDSTSVHFGFGHKCHKHGKLFDLQHIGTCNLLSGCPDIAKYAEMIKRGDNIR
jgi:hypothetical protein